MSEYNPFILLRALDGAPLSCLIALLIHPNPLRKSALVRATGYSSTPVTTALAFLEHVGFVTQDGKTKTWQLTDLALEVVGAFAENVRKISVNWHATAALSIKDLKDLKAAAVESLKACPEPPEKIAESTKPSPLPQGEEDHPQPTPAKPAKSSPAQNRIHSDAHRLLRFAHIGEPIATRMSNLDHLTPLYLAGHILKGKADQISVGLLIHRLKSADPAPELNKNYHILGCTCMDCDHLRFRPDHGRLAPKDFNLKTFLGSCKPQPYPRIVKPGVNPASTMT